MYEFYAKLYPRLSLSALSNDKAYYRQVFAAMIVYSHVRKIMHALVIIL
jgi:hypothetical protein